MESIAGRYVRAYEGKPNCMRIMCHVNGELLSVGGGSCEYRFTDGSELMMRTDGTDAFEYDPDDCDD